MSDALAFALLLPPFPKLRSMAVHVLLPSLFLARLQPEAEEYELEGGREALALAGKAYVI